MMPSVVALASRAIFRKSAFASRNSVRDGGGEVMGARSNVAVEFENPNGGECVENAFDVGQKVLAL